MSLMKHIRHATGISTEVLRGQSLSEVSEQDRFSWIARRKTTIEEDAVYCLLGIFDVHMSPIYGEGQIKAQMRLQREIRLRDSPDLYALKEAAWIVPFERNSRFTGRQSHLVELEGKLAINNGTIKVAVIGLGGIGKTQVVLEMLYRYRSRHKSCSIIWISAASMDRIEQDYLAVAQQLRILGCEDEKADVKKLVQDYLSRSEAGPWVVVYDNADDIDMWTAVLPPTSGDLAKRKQSRSSIHISRRLIDYLPQHAQGSIIFTTRNRMVAVRVASTSMMTVPAMSEQDATQLLGASLNNQSLLANPQDISALLTTLTYLPLAITQAAAYINANGIGISEYCSLLEEKKEEDVINVLNQEFEDHGRYRDIKNSVATTWLVSFEQIFRSDPLAADYLSFMACICHQDIPQSLLPSGPSRKEETDAIGTLTAYSFITRQPANDMLDMHPLVHLTTRDWLRRENPQWWWRKRLSQRKTLQSWTEKAFDRLQEVLPRYPHGNTLNIWRSYLPHVRHVLACNMVKEEGDVRSELRMTFGKCLLQNRQLTDAETIFRQVIEARTTVQGENGRGVLEATKYLARTYYSQGHLVKATELTVQLVDRSKKKLGVKDPDTLYSMQDLNFLHRYRNQWAEAEKVMTQAIEVSKKKHGARDIKTLAFMEDLAATYTGQKRWLEAEQIQDEIFEKIKEEFGPDGNYATLNRERLAIVYREQERHGEAEQLQMQVLQHRKAKIGAEHSATIRITLHLAATYSKQKRWTEAETLQMQALQSSKAKFGSDFNIVWDVTELLAQTYNGQERWTEAEQLQSPILELRKTKQGIDHPDTLRSMHRLACTWKGLGHDQEAIQMLSDCAERQARVLGVEHSMYIESQGKLKEWGTTGADENTDVRAAGNTS